MISVKTILQSIALFVVLLAGMFFVAPQEVDACSVVLDSSTRFRTAYTPGGGPQPAPFLSSDEDSELPFVYMDIKMTGCSETDTVYLHVFGLRDGFGVRYTIKDHQVSLSQFIDGAGNVSFTQAFRADEGPCFGEHDDTGPYECLVLGMVTDGVVNSDTTNILGIIGNMIGRIPFVQSQTFSAMFGSGAQPVSPDCDSVQSFIYRTHENCNSYALWGWGGPYANGTANYLLHPGHSNEKLIEYYNQRYNTSFELVPIGLNNVPVATLGFPALLYNCYHSGLSTGCSGDDWFYVGNPIEYGTSHPDDNGPVVGEPLASSYQESYIPLAPLPFEGLNGGSTPSLPSYLQGVFNAVIIVIIVLAVIMIVFAGITHFFSVSATGKEGKRELAWNAVIGLVIALGSWLLLNTISPRLASNLSIQIPEVELTVDQQLYAEYEQMVPESGQAFVLNGTFENPQTSAGLSSFLNTVNSENPITGLVVNTSSLNMVITSSAGSSVTIPVTGLGQNGVAEVGQGVSQDRKTPKGDWETTTRTRVAQNMNDAQISQGGFSMGPAFIGTNIATSSGEIRGIWIHGNQNNQPGPTMGCVRLSNDDVLALARKINPGVSLVIQ